MIHIGRAASLLDAASRLGVRPVLLAAWHRGAERALARRRLVRRVPAADSEPVGDVLPRRPPLTPLLPTAHRITLLERAAAVRSPDWHDPFPPGSHALDLDLFNLGDIRPVWERNRWAELPLLAQAACLDPAGGHLARAEALIADWRAANTAFLGPNWACGQEAALRVLHLGLTLALLGADRAPPPGATSLLRTHARRIMATPAYALAQDNNHPVSEAAGLMACGLLLGDGTWARAGAARLETALLRLVGSDGVFAQVSTGYHRLFLDVLAVVEWLRRRLEGPALSSAAMARAAAATAWLVRLAEPTTGALPRLGHQDGSAFADLSLAGPDDVRPSLERAARLFCGGSAGHGEDPGCAWLGLAAGPVLPTSAGSWVGEGLRIWQAGKARAVLRTGPLRFRPGQADLLHLDLWDGPLALLRDGGTGAYNPPSTDAWWHVHFTGTAAHNTIAFDGEDQMLRLSRFLFAHWPETGPLPDGAWLQDWRGRRHARQVRVEGALQEAPWARQGRRWVVEDRVSGRFRHAVLRWRLAPGPWCETANGVEGPQGRLSVRADGPLRCRLEQGWESPAYGEVRPTPLLCAAITPAATTLETVIDLNAQL